MKNITFYLFLFSLLLSGATRVVAQGVGEADCPFTVVIEGGNTNSNIDKNKRTLIIEGSSFVTITKNENFTDWLDDGGVQFTDWCIVLNSRGRLNVTIKDLNIACNVPLTVEGSDLTLILEGTSRFISTAETGQPGIAVLGSVGISIDGSGSLIVRGAKGTEGKNGKNGGAGIGCPANQTGGALAVYTGLVLAEGGAGAPGIGCIQDDTSLGVKLIGGTITAIGGGGEKSAPGIYTGKGKLSIELDAFVIAVSGIDAQGNAAEETRYNDYSGGLLIQGKQLSGGVIEQTSFKLVMPALSWRPYFQLTAEAEIPAWATVTVGKDQKIIIPDGQTLVNNGTLTIESGGTLDINGNGTVHNDGTVHNNGTLSLQDGGILTDDGEIVTGEGGKTTCTVTLEFTGDNITNKDIDIFLRDPDTGMFYPMIRNTNCYSVSDLPVIDKPYEVFVNETYPVGATVKVPSVNNTIEVFVLTFKIGQDSYVVYRVTDKQGGDIPQYKPSVSKDYHSIKWYTAEDYQKEILDWSYSTICNNPDKTIYGKWMPNPILTVTLPPSLVGETEHAVTPYALSQLIDPADASGPKSYAWGDGTENYGLSLSGDAQSGYFISGTPSKPTPAGGDILSVKITAANGEVSTASVPLSVSLYMPPPPPTPVYYTVSLPAVEGASTDPVAGDYEVESWDTFRFYLTLEAAYNQSVPVVTTSRGETIQPRTSDGAYLVKYVRSDVSIRIDGVVRNPDPVANEPISVAPAAPQIWTERSMLCILIADDAAGHAALPATASQPTVRILTFDGRLMHTFRAAPGLTRRQLPTGMYVIQVDNVVRKVAVR